MFAFFSFEAYAVHTVEFINFHADFFGVIMLIKMFSAGI